MQSIIGFDNASLLNLIAQIGMLIALYVGYYFAKIKKFRPQHANIQTSVVLLNLFFILFIMASSAMIILQGARFNSHPNPFILLHILLGIVSELLGIYLVIRMRTSWLPPNLRVKNFKRLMQFTLGLWTATVLFGLVIYASFYLGLK